mmetsp:Transcript_31492/g.61441  ORF Transcript_31492/g.61441 Transcript_31492/m.61441 type:complete len:200 (-) Transcript_31492:686-1285(-)
MDHALFLISLWIWMISRATKMKMAIWMIFCGGFASFEKKRPRQLKTERTCRWEVKHIAKGLGVLTQMLRQKKLICLVLLQRATSKALSIFFKLSGIEAIWNRNSLSTFGTVRSKKLLYSLLLGQGRLKSHPCCYTTNRPLMFKMLMEIPHCTSLATYTICPSLRKLSITVDSPQSKISKANFVQICFRLRLMAKLQIVQ